MKYLIVIIVTLVIWNIVLTLNIQNLNDYDKTNTEMWEQQVENSEVSNEVIELHTKTLDIHNQLFEYLAPELTRTN